MKKKKAKKWLENTVNDVFMNFLYYDRKGCEIMGVEKLRKLMDDGTISKEMMVEAFINQIEKEY